MLRDPLPAVVRTPGTMLTTPAGMPTSAMSSARRSDVSGVSSDGFITAQLPAANAGPSFQPQNMSGKFHGHDLADDAERIA